MVLDEDDDKYHVQSAMREGLEELHRTKHDNNPLRHRVHVCIVCDAVIIGTENINRLKKTGLEGAQSTFRCPRVQEIPWQRRSASRTRETVLS